MKSRNICIIYSLTSPFRSIQGCFNSMQNAYLEHFTCPSPCIADCLNCCCWARSCCCCCWGSCISFCRCCCCVGGCCCCCCGVCCWGDGVFIIFVEDLGELAYGIGEAVVLSKEVAPVAAEGDAADLPMSCGPEVYITNNRSEDEKKSTTRRIHIIQNFLKPPNEVTSSHSIDLKVQQQGECLKGKYQIGKHK